MTRRELLVCALAGVLSGCDRTRPPVVESAKAPASDSGSDVPANGFLGIQIADPNIAPLTIDGFVPNSQAGTSGLKPGDVVLRVGRQWDPTYDQLMSMLESSRPGDVVGVRVLRDGEELEYRVTLMSYESVERAMEEAHRGL